MIRACQTTVGTPVCPPVCTAVDTAVRASKCAAHTLAPCERRVQRVAAGADRGDKLSRADLATVQKLRLEKSLHQRFSM
eukprot:975196-Pleurochrysis_carterae.AAC.2